MPAVFSMRPGYNSSLGIAVRRPEPMRKLVRAPWRVGIACLVAASACRGGTTATAPPSASTRWCDLLPRPANAALPRVSVSSDWYFVYRAADGVFAIAEPLQFEETISYLIVGRDRALLFDTGLGLVPIRPVVEELTRLPVVVLNSHTHFDHVGGNADFDRILARDTEYTRSNARGFPHEALAGEVEPTSLCRGVPPGVDTSAYHTRAWKPAGTVAEGDRIELGGRTLEVLEVPGHTPDAIALLDRAHGLLWTGDTYYDSTIWLYVPETSLDDYERSIGRLAALAPQLERLLPAHNTAAAEPRRLVAAKEAIRKIRAGSVKGRDESGNRVVFPFDGFSILVSQRLLEGKTGDASRGGSGLE
jgi:glyoxylase-like metal-dependent hydrolase (beta-lactamase superfamily II)